MNHLQIFQEAVDEAGLGVVPTTVVGVSGDLLVVKRHIQRTYQWICMRYTDWDWLWDTFSFETLRGKSEYNARTASVPLRTWRIHNARGYAGMKIYHPTEGGIAEQRPLAPAEWAEFEPIYRQGVVPDNVPSRVALTSKNNLALGPAPNRGIRDANGAFTERGYIVTGEFYRSFVPLVEDADVPLMPEDYHPMLVYGAVTRFARKDEDVSLMAEHGQEFSDYFDRLAVNERPQLRVGRPIVASSGLGW